MLLMIHVQFRNRVNYIMLLDKVKYAFRLAFLIELS